MSLNVHVVIGQDIGFIGRLEPSLLAQNTRVCTLELISIHDRLVRVARADRTWGASGGERHGEVSRDGGI